VLRRIVARLGLIAEFLSGSLCCAASSLG